MRVRSRWPTSPTRCRCKSITDTVHDQRPRRPRWPTTPPSARRRSPRPRARSATTFYDARNRVARVSRVPASRRSPTSTTTAACCGARRRATARSRWELRRPRPPDRAHRRRGPAHGARPTTTTTAWSRSSARAGASSATSTTPRAPARRSSMPGGQRHELNHDARGALSGYKPAGGREARARPRQRRAADRRGRRRRPDDLRLRRTAVARPARRGPTRSSSTATTAALDRPRR